MEKLSGWVKKASKYHDELMKAMAPNKKEKLKTSKIKEIIKGVSAFRGEEQWIYPSDHCSNHTNKGACRCALTNEALFKKIGKRGEYQVL